MSRIERFPFSNPRRNHTGEDRPTTNISANRQSPTRRLEEMRFSLNEMEKDLETVILSLSNRNFSPSKVRDILTQINRAKQAVGLARSLLME